ncbi:MAG TPA: DUF481 domain-containing protein [Gammaproteobacteria bacterium]|nr:DUF481 domain-containing protein [Gammaproteobacteria bacterium]
MKNTKRKGVLSLLAGGLLLVTLAARADVVLLDNGDRISGEVVAKSAGKLVIDTPWAGKLELPWSKVVGVTTERPLLFRLEDGIEIRGTLRSEDGGVVLVDQDGGSHPVASLAAIAEAGAIPSELPPPLEWRGHANLAAQAVRGNTDTDALSLDTRVVGEAKGIRRYTVAAALNKERSAGSLTKEQYLLGGKYDHFFSQRWFGYVSADFEKDKFKDLDLRSIYSAGSGYQFFDTDELRVSLEGGLAYTDEDFIVNDDDSYAGLQWALNWEQAFFDKRLAFFHRHQGNQGLDTADNLLIRAQTGVTVPILDGLQAVAEYDVTWDRSPPDNTDSTDSTYKLGLGYAW